MDHLEEVSVIDRFRSHWVARGPLGMRVEWDAQIISDIPPTLLSWKSVGDSDVVSAGSVRFKALGEHATEVRVKLSTIRPPASSSHVSWLLGDDSQHQIAEDLRRFNELIEAGETSTNGRYRATTSSQRVRRELDSSEISSDFGSMR